MPIRRKQGNKENSIYRNERFTKGTLTSNDPMYEGSFRRLINFKVSNQNASLENRDPFITVPLFDLQNKEIKLSLESFVFSLNEDTEHSFVIDFNQETEEIYGIGENILPDLEYNTSTNTYNYGVEVVDGDTIKVANQRYRLAIIDAPEIDDEIYSPSPSGSGHTTLGQEAKEKLEELILDKNFEIIQYDFQSEKIDEFGRPLVFIKYLEDGKPKFANIEILREGYASFYNVNSFKNTLVSLLIPSKIFSGEDLNNPYFWLAEELKKAYKEAKEKSWSPVSTKYFTKDIQMSVQENYVRYNKPKVYKIKKDTDLKMVQFQHWQNDEFYNKVLKRSIKEFELNETKVKLDLEVFTDESLRYVLRSSNFIVTNTKYENQAVVVLISVYNIENEHLYTGPAEITRTSPNPEEGIFETINIRTYNNPEMHVELQNLTNFKPNMLSANSIIPKRIEKEKANILGYTTPSVDAVLLSVDVDKELNINEDEVLKLHKYLQPTSPKWNDINSYKIEPIFKAPIILNSEKKNYMFRWDLITNKKLESFEEEDIKNFKPIFRSDWVDLNDFNKNITMDNERIINQMLSKKEIQTVDNVYIITLDHIFDKTSEEEITDPYDIDINDLEISDEKIEYIENVFETNLLNMRTAHHIKGFLMAMINGTSLGISEVTSVEKIDLNKNLLNDIVKFEKDDNLVYLDIRKSQRNKPLTSIDKILEDKDKRNLFIFMPFVVALKDEDKKERHIFHTKAKHTIIYQEKEEQKLPLELDFNELQTKTFNDKSFKEFFEDGFTAVFYLSTYESAENLLETDSFYDILAYKQSSTTYTFKKIGSKHYLPSDFVKENFAKESLAIKYCNYISQFDDKVLMYGNSMFRNSVFMSEEGSPYYFPLVNTFEFDFEVVHVQQFKTIMLVFTINDIWAIYEIEEKEQQEYKDENGETKTYETTKRSFRSKKILYNISTTHENKCTIKNISRYITLMSNDVLYLIRPSLYISDDTQFTLNILSTNIDALIKDPLEFINERLIYFGIDEEATKYKMNFNATDNFIKIYYSVKVQNIPYTLILTYDILNGRWYEEDTISFGNPKQIYLLDSTTGYEMLTEIDNRVYFTYNTDKFKNMLLNEFSESLFDISPSEFKYTEHKIQNYIDTGNIKLNEHLRKRFRHLYLNLKNIDSKEILFNYDFSVDDVQFKSLINPEYTTNTNNEVVEIKMDTTKIISSVGSLDNFLLDFSNLHTSDIMMIKNTLLGKGRIPRIKMNFSTTGRFYILSYSITYREREGN